MGDSTAKLGLYLPGGGSTGSHGADESADIDKINANMQILDGATGFQVVTSTTKPTTHYDGMPILVSDAPDGNKLEVWSDTDSNWVKAVIIAMPTVPDIIVSNTPMTAGTPIDRVRLY